MPIVRSVTVPVLHLRISLIMNEAFVKSHNRTPRNPRGTLCPPAPGDIQPLEPMVFHSSYGMLAVNEF